MDHGKDGASLILERCHRGGASTQYAAEILALCIAWHHGGLPDFIDPDAAEPEGRIPLLRRCAPDSQYAQSRGRFFTEIASEAELDALFAQATGEMRACLSRLERDTGHNAQFQLHLLVKLLYSCLIDADRTDTLGLEAQLPPEPEEAPQALWPVWAARVEARQTDFRSRREAIATREAIRRLRCEIADRCRAFAPRDTGIYTLTVPTGGGKILSSLWYALEHARIHGKKRIVFVVPYTAIIEQNAQTVRKLLQCGDDLLEFHSLVLVRDGSEVESGRKEEDPRRKLLTAHWDCPIIFTTMVQFLDTIYAAGTQKIRRLPAGGGEKLHPAAHEHRSHGRKARRADENRGERAGRDQHRGLGGSAVSGRGRRAAAGRQGLLSEHPPVSHPPTGYFQRNPRQAGPPPVTPLVCVSTKLIEAGVDLCFGTAVRFQAGLDSVAQAAGRANRHGEDDLARAYVVRPEQECLSHMPDLVAGISASQGIFNTFSETPEHFGGDLLSPYAIAEYCRYYFGNADIQSQMDCPYGGTSLFALLSGTNVVSSYRNSSRNGGCPLQLGLRFGTASAAFRVIAEDTQAVVVPWGSGRALADRWRSDCSFGERRALLRRMQPYCVNLYAQLVDALEKAGALTQYEGVLLLSEEFYDPRLGVVTDGRAMGLLDI